MLGDGPLLLGQHQDAVVAAELGHDVIGDLVDHAEHVFDVAVVFSAQRWPPVDPSMSWAARRARSPDHRTLPSRTPTGLPQPRNR